ncbi:MAG TPA: HypC/HybG/HupF family hydrogenase formation chaperone [Gammaproteobacteria bacterium]|nr:HypC/HybG/HupF family hydrogenase formation chaperone [Gammaproteobacteria bacterium]
MCLALPAEIVEIDSANDNAIVSLEGVKKTISLALVEDVQVGDFVLVHVGYALNKVSQDEAQKTLSLMAEAGLMNPGVGAGGES